MDIREIERGLKKPGKSKTGLAKALGRSNPAVTGILKGTRLIKADEVPVIRKYLELNPTVPIRGSVGAGSEAHFYGEASDDPAESTLAPDGASPDTVAVEIKGDSLGVALNGWLAFYDARQDPPSEALLNKLCVVGLSNGQVLIKQIRASRQRGRYHLYPNAGGEPILDAKVDWAAKVIDMRPKN